MRDYVEQVKELRDFAVEFDLEDHTETAIMLANAADAIEELLARACPHYHRNVHDRGDDSYCDVLNREVPQDERTAWWVDTQPHLDDSSYKKDGMSYYCSNCHHRAGK